MEKLGKFEFPNHECEHYMSVAFDKINEIVDAVNDLELGLYDGKMIGAYGKVNLLMPIWNTLSAQSDTKIPDCNIHEKLVQSDDKIPCETVKKSQVPTFDVMAISPDILKKAQKKQEPEMKLWVVIPECVGRHYRVGVDKDQIIKDYNTEKLPKKYDVIVREVAVDGYRIKLEKIEE